MSIVELLQQKDAGGIRCQVEVHSEWISSAKEVEQRLKDFGGDGWTCFTDGWKWIRGGETKGAESIQCLPLSAERCAKGRSAQLRYHGDRWQWVVIEEKPGDASEDVAWAFDESFVSSVGPRMRYRVYWVRDSRAVDHVRPFRPFAARMLGWESESSEEEK
ncbi:MAG: hypothetical protein ACOX6T_18435 [Myxococcales bacterium]|jgi:hypothetical protein